MQTFYFELTRIFELVDPHTLDVCVCVWGFGFCCWLAGCLLHLREIDPGDDDEFSPFCRLMNSLARMVHGTIVCCSAFVWWIVIPLAIGCAFAEMKPSYK